MIKILHVVSIELPNTRNVVSRKQAAARHLKESESRKKTFWIGESVAAALKTISEDGELKPKPSG